MLKYDPLNKFLSGQADDNITLSFLEIERIIGDKLPASAYKHPVWWDNSNTKAHPYSRAWTEAGYYTTDVSKTIGSQKINFDKRIF